MRLRRLLLACSVLFVVALAWNGLFRLVVLRGAEAAVRAVYRPNLADRMWLSLLVAAAMVVLFVVGYRRFARSGSVREAAGGIAEPEWRGRASFSSGTTGVGGGT